jgi:two-component system, LytTR family, response regulator LytT
MTLNCIAVDDEPLALELINSYIRQTPFLKLLEGFSTAIGALDAIHKSPVDLIFLDIQMPDLSGIELAKVLDKGPTPSSPRIIFTTAFDQYAIEGYRVDALDYLLKPFNYSDFLRAANKALKYAELISSSKAASDSATEDNFLFLKVEYQLLKIPFNQILYIEGLKDYVKVHLAGEEKSILSLITLKNLEEKLPSGKFMRIHRSFIVSLDKIKAVSRNMVIIGQTTIPVSDQFKDAFNAFLLKKS